MKIYFFSNSSYINHFTQPDTIIPDASNPQAFNRYSYVGNNPIMRNDPTGHKWDDCSNVKGGYRCKIHMKHAAPAIAEGNRIAAEEKAAKAATTNTSGLMIYSFGQITVSNVTATVPLPPAIFGVTTSGDNWWSGGGSDYSELELVAIGLWAKYGKMVLEGLRLTENYGIPAYKHARGLGTFGGPVVEGAIGFLLQGANDWNNPNLSAPQKFSNAVLMGIESGLTDAISTPVAAILAAPWGVAGAAVCGACGGISYAAGFTLYSLAINEVATGLFWDPIVNERLMFK